MSKLVINLIVGISAVYLSLLYIPGVSATGGPFGRPGTIIIVGAVLGLANFFLKPLIAFITLPLRILTFGLFGLIINMALIFITETFIPFFSLTGILSYFYMALLIWVLNLLSAKILK